MSVGLNKALHAVAVHRITSVSLDLTDVNEQTDISTILDRFDKRVIKTLILDNVAPDKKNAIALEKWINSLPALETLIIEDETVFTKPAATGSPKPNP